MGCIVFDPSSQAPLGEFILPRFRAPTHGLGIMCICVFIVCKLRVVRTPSGQHALCEIMYHCAICICRMSGFPRVCYVWPVWVAMLLECVARGLVSV